MFEDRMAVSGKRQRIVHFSIKFKRSVQSVSVRADVNGVETYHNKIGGICIGTRTHTARFAAYEKFILVARRAEWVCHCVCVRSRLN